tara:strand:+ start:6609 stop:6890 length:282 start_codon:yes stop_codon:yes gene_type:complete
MTETENFQFKTAGEQIQELASKLSEHIAPELIYEAMFYTAVRAELRYAGNKELSIAHLMAVMAHAIKNEEDEYAKNNGTLLSLSEKKTSDAAH